MMERERYVRQRASRSGNIHAEKAGDQRGAPHVWSRRRYTAGAIDQLIRVQYGVESGNRGKSHRIIRRQDVLCRGCVAN